MTTPSIIEEKSTSEENVTLFKISDVVVGRMEYVPYMNPNTDLFWSVNYNGRDDNGCTSSFKKGKAEIKKRLIFLFNNPEPKFNFEVGRIFRGKNKRLFYYDDRVVLWISSKHSLSQEIQYDSPVVGTGQHYPKISRLKFEMWAMEDVTEEYKNVPSGQWATINS